MSWHQERPLPSVAATRRKSCTEKVMFLESVACPKFDHHANKMFDGEIGIWPIGTVVKAQKSKQQESQEGRRKCKNMTVNSRTHLDLMHEVIISVGLAHSGTTQLSLSRFVPKKNWPVMLKELALEGVSPNANKIKFIAQLPKSPDLNINDLGLFAAPQAMHW